MNRPISVVALLVILTAANVGYQYSRSSGRQATWRSSLARGAKLPELDATPLRSASANAATRSIPSALSTGCRLLVLFSTECPHCHTAAARDAAAWDSTWTVPVVWITNVDNAATAEFAAIAGIHAQVRVAGPKTLDALKAAGVPAGFLVSAKDTVLWVGAYGGGASEQSGLRRMCTEAT